ncbi:MULTISPECIES: cation diffusion facilitator family transporter [Sanguibacteroides]|uniref:Cation transporter n=1 Tax=Sanguibacteroides justesenii TaxID=1547597 RepID=A0A0C3R4I2_9PORP|nr:MULTISPECIES: cation diffusion facilitator family transporter [Sanguibacteroides]KIO44325.1 cation transporter [Sanguibacteroides justesenii]PXZ44703.1 cation transporter [Sanguibacteroides justesenii]
MEHTHEHHHHRITSLNKAFIIGITLNTAFVVVEFVAGFWFNSLGLLSDAGHNLSDVFSLVLAMLAFRLSRVQANTKYTYGYKKSTVLASLLNAVILLIAVGFILGESINKLFHPQPVDGDAVAWVAGVGVVINGITAWLFMKDKEKDLNVKGAYLHMAADALVSIGVLVSGLIIANTGWNIIDPLIGIGIAVIIVYSTWGLLRDSIRLSLDGVPAGTDYRQVEKTIASARGVKGFHHLHIWALSTTETALTVHVVIDDMSQMETVKCDLKHELEHIGIIHATLEFEAPGSHCKDCQKEYSD